MVIRINNNGVGGLYIGDIFAAKDEELLKKHKISAVLTVAPTDLKYVNSFVKNHLVINAQDEVTYKMRPHFENCFKFITENRKYTNVLVHCLAGISRSATIVIAYLMKRRKLTLNQAYNKVKRHREEVNPNTGF